MMLGLAMASRARASRSLRTRRLGGHLVRSCCNLFTMICFYLALKLIPLPNAICIGLASPIFVTILSIPMLKEHVGIRRWSAVVVGFLGIILIAQPTDRGHQPRSRSPPCSPIPAAAGAQWGTILALLSAMAWAATQVSSRQLSTSEPSHRILFYYSLVVVVVLGAAMPFYWITPAAATC